MIVIVIDSQSSTIHVKNEWNPNKHPRKPDGEFTKKGESDTYPDKLRDNDNIGNKTLDKFDKSCKVRPTWHRLTLPKAEYGEVCHSMNNSFKPSMVGRVRRHYMDNRVYTIYVRDFDDYDVLNKKVEQ